MSSSDGDPPGRPKPPGVQHPSSTIVGIVPPTSQPAPAPVPPPKRSSLPPPRPHGQSGSHSVPPMPRPAIPEPHQPPPSGPVQPLPAAPSGPTPQPPVPPPPPGPYTAGPQIGSVHAPSAPPPFAGQGMFDRGPHPADSIEEVPGSKFVSFLKISSKRAFRLRIEPNEVLATERRSLESATPPITDRNLQAFLAWRRSVLFLVACALVPLTLIGLIDGLSGTMPRALRFVKLAPAIAEGLFCWICWAQLKQWAHWRTQRRRLFWGWMLFMATPFVVFLYPLRTVAAEAVGGFTQTLSAYGIEGVRRAAAQAVAPFAFAMIAMLQLAPKAISLMPGLIRASLVIKLLFPGSTAPGWMIVLVTPLYALLAYVILIVPYQFTGSGWFIAGVLGIVAGQAVLARAGFALARPLTEEEALKQIRRIRTYYMVVMTVSALLIVVALGSLVEARMLRWADVVTAVLKFETNVLILTMIGSDLVVTNLDKAREQTVGRGHVEAQTEVKIAAFVSLEAPPPPPPGPAQ